MQNEQIAKLTEDVSEKIALLKSFISAQDKQLEEMTISEWGGVRGQQMQGQVNRLSAALAYMEVCFEHLTEAAKFEV